mmetsp:Transcript_57245/g.124370  ORF Transcript_57245/g.124370 Transcript_57245/m.124370 type:complete len:193 (-) Transcript_57245:296-874(-)
MAISFQIKRKRPVVLAQPKDPFFLVSDSEPGSVHEYLAAADDFGHGEAARKAMELGGCLAQSGYWREALRQFDKATQYAPDSSSAHEQRAQVLLELGSVFDAVLAAERACLYSPEWGDAHLTLARCQLNYGELQLSLESFDKALSLSCTEDIASVASEAEETDALLIEQSIRHGISGRRIPGYSLPCSAPQG